MQIVVVLLVILMQIIDWCFFVTGIKWFSVYCDLRRWSVLCVKHSWTIPRLSPGESL